MISKEKKLVIALLKEKIEKATGKKVVFEDTQAEKVKALIERLEKIVGRAVVLEDVAAVTEELEEGIFGTKSEAEVQKEFLNTINVWKTKGYVAPNAQEFQAIMTAAKADKFAGKLGVDTNKKIIYRPASQINWNNQFAGGGTGTATGGTSGA